MVNFFIWRSNFFITALVPRVGRRISMLELDRLGSVYGILLMVTVALTAALTFIARRGADKSPTSASFKKFRNTYLIVFWIAMAGDWLQGPYVYALYSSYGLSQADIAALFVAGFGSSMVFGTFIGGVADRIGRKKCALM